MDFYSDNGAIKHIFKNINNINSIKYDLEDYILKIISTEKISRLNKIIDIMYNINAINVINLLFSCFIDALIKYIM